MPSEPTVAGDTVPKACRIIEVRVAGLGQLFNAVDSSRFREPDLDSRAEEFIVDWSKALHRPRLARVIHLEREA